jgi:hypothetical protein
VPRAEPTVLSSSSRELKEQQAHSTLIGAVGRVVIANQQLLLHWATREDGLGIDEDTLFAELQASGAEGWQQVLNELRPTDKEPSDDGPEEWHVRQRQLPRKRRQGRGDRGVTSLIGRSAC